jgi:MarR family transcriptional regulator, organic hydroperoxide resistance regulator
MRSIRTPSGCSASIGIVPNGLSREQPSCPSRTRQLGDLEMSAVELRDLFHELILIESRLRRSVDSQLQAEYELTLSRLELLRVVAAHDGCQIRDIVAALSLTTGGASKLVDRAQREGHCRRRPHPTDRRSSIVELTSQGQRLLAPASRTLESIVQAQLGPALSPTSLKQFASLIEALRAAWPPA